MLQIQNSALPLKVLNYARAMNEMKREGLAKTGTQVFF